MKGYLKLFKLNDKIELRTSDGIKNSGFFYDMKDDKVYVSISADDAGFKLLKIGESIEVDIYCCEKLVRFDAKISARLFANNSVYELSQMKNFREIQRRENIRVTHVEKVFYSGNKFLQHYDADKGLVEDRLKEIDRYLKEGFMLDLSAGGIKMSTKENFNIGKKLILVISLKEKDMILKGRVVYKEINFIPKRTVYRYGIKFIDIKTSQQEKIISHLFVMMRKNRNK